MNTSVVIPVYKNTDLFLKNLRHNLPYLKDCQIIIVNDDPAESIASVLPPIDNLVLIENKTNMGFGKTVNKGVEKADKKYLLLLNTDVKLMDESWRKGREYFTHDAQLFAVSFAQKEKDGSIVGRNAFFWKDGLFQHKGITNREGAINGWAEGGSCIVDKEKFTILHGFDELYSPFYWEDIDISYRAWKKGYKVLFTPEIFVEHHHESTIGTYFKDKQIKQIAFRNQLIFIWKNIGDGQLLLSHGLFLIRFFLLVLFKTDQRPYMKSFIQALKVLPEVIKKRQSSLSRVSDKKVLSSFQ